MIPRTVHIGEHINATTAFFEDGQPIESKDPSTSPIFVVRDIHGDVICGGVGTLNETDGLYHASFTVPNKAPISSSDAKYVIEWELEGNNNKKYKSLEYFDVTHPSFDTIDLKEQQKLTLPFSNTTLSIPLPEKPQEITFELYDSNNNSVFKSEEEDIKNTGVYDSYFIYNTNIPENIMKEERDYVGVWKFMFGGESNHLFQKIQCTDIWTMSLLSDMRMYLDKVAKAIDLYVGYRDSDLYFHLMNGLDIVNMVTPITQWDMVSFKGSMGLPGFIPLGGGCYSALRAQYLAEGDSAFDYNGQPVTLSVDRTQYIEAELSRWQDWLREDLKQFKKQWVHRRRGFHLGITWPNVRGWGGVGGYDIRHEGQPINRTIGSRIVR